MTHIEHLNPVTRSLLRQLSDPQLSEFVVRWDALEALVIRVFRGQVVTSEDEAEHNRVRTWLAQAYPRWQKALQPHWQQATIAGRAVSKDPFAYLLDIEQARYFAGDWSAMQTLPAAREALNHYLVDLLHR
jgi:hypothetical protein